MKDYLECGFPVPDELFGCIISGDFDSFTKLLSRDPDLESRESFFDNTPLIHAVQKGKVEFLEPLLAKGADVNARSAYGITALHLASESGNLPIVRILVKNGADMESQNESGYTPLDRAGNEDVVNYLQASMEE